MFEWFRAHQQKKIYSMNAMYQAIGISKQAVNQYAKRQKVFDEKVQKLMQEAEELRKEHPGCGVEKMYHTLQPDFIGRDRFIDLFMELGFRVKRNKNYRRTTFSSSVYYPNLIKGMIISKPSEVWQSDITYIEMEGKYYYAVFIIDVYTKEIVGYQLSNHMRATANIKALEMALKDNKPPKIHHSDRGSQYIYKEYIGLLKSKNTTISMALTAQDNAYAERINRTIKEEYLAYWKPNTYEQLKKCIEKAVYHYNNKRVHNALNPMKITPREFKKYIINLSEQDRPKVTIYTESQDKIEVASSHHDFKQDLTQVQNCPNRNLNKMCNKTVNSI